MWKALNGQQCNKGMDHDKGSGERSLIGVHGSVTGNNKSVTGDMEMQRVGMEV